MEQHSDAELEQMPGSKLVELALQFPEGSDAWKRVWAYMTNKWRAEYNRRAK